VGARKQPQKQPQKRPVWQRPGWRFAGVVVVVLAAVALADVGESRALIRGLLYWSLVAVPIAVGIVFFGRFLGSAGGFLGGGSPYDGHGPEDRHRR
jgi:hypothetical protein